MRVLTDKIAHPELLMTATTSAFSSLLLIACKPARTKARWNAFQCYIHCTHGATAALSWLAHAASGADQVLHPSATKSNNLCKSYCDHSQQQQHAWSNLCRPYCDHLQQHLHAWSNLCKPYCDRLQQQQHAWSNLCKPYCDHLQQQQHAWSSMERSAGSSNLMGWPSGWPSGAVGGRLPAVDIMRLCSFTCSTVWKREMMVQCCFMSVPSTMSIISLRKRTCTRQGHHNLLLFTVTVNFVG